MSHRKSRSLYRRRSFQQSVAVLVIVVIAGIGTYLLSASHAQSPYVASEAENGTLAGTAALQSDNGASGGKYVQFGTGPSSGGGSTPTKVLGIYDGGHEPTSVGQVASWLGGSSDVTYAMEFVDDTSWDTISNPSWFLSQWSGSPYTMVWGVSMVPCGAPSTACAPNATDFDMVANGSADSYYKTLAQNLVSSGFGSSFIRLGWEFQGGWFPWTICNSDGQADFVPAFRNIVTTMRSVSGANFKFIWNPDISTATSCAGKVENYYPGDSYVDVVSLDVYDTDGAATSAQTRWQHLLDGVNSGGWTATQPNDINGQSFAGYGLNWIKAFGDEHSKLIGLPEWGLWNDGSADSGGDDTYFIDQMATWIKANATGPANYWNFGTSILDVTGDPSGSSPNASAAFQKDFAGY